MKSQRSIIFKTIISFTVYLLNPYIIWISVENDLWYWCVWLFAGVEFLLMTIGALFYCCIKISKNNGDMNTYHDMSRKLSDNFLSSEIKILNHPFFDFINWGTLVVSCIIAGFKGYYIISIIWLYSFIIDRILHVHIVNYRKV